MHAMEPPRDHPASRVPDDASLPQVAAIARGCTACDLYAHATQTVFGEGRAPAPLMLIGEQPGDREDRAGEPFVGPAGAVLDRALEAAGIDRERVFVTNVVKHFKWRPSGKRRLHERPNAGEVRACRPWLDIKMEIVRPDLIVALGATAAQALLGPEFRITEGRGEILTLDGNRQLLATLHPSAVLRARSSHDRAAMEAQLIADLSLAASTVAAR